MTDPGGGGGGGLAIPNRPSIAHWKALGKRVYPFTGLDYWTGILDWTTGLTFESKFNHKN